MVRTVGAGCPRGPWADGAARGGRSGLRRHLASTGLLLIDGRLAGHWRRRCGVEHVDVEVHPSGFLDAAARSALEAEADVFGTFLGLQTRLTVTV